MRSPFLIPDPSEPLCTLPGQRLSSIDSVNESVDGLFYRHTTDWAGCVHRGVNRSPSAYEELHGLYEVTVIVIPVPGIKSAHLILSHAVSYRHSEPRLFCHFYG